MDSKFEAKLVVQALRINTLSKLTFSDCARFNALMKDVFPGIEFKDIEYEELAEAIRSVCKEANLRVNEIQVGTHYIPVGLTFNPFVISAYFIQSGSLQKLRRTVLYRNQ